MKKSPIVQRIKRLRSRQSTSAWVQNYKPGTRATRGEAPSISNPTLIRRCPKFGRDLHALSHTELKCLMLGLWLDNIIDVNEQKVLQPFESPHPLTNHPLATGLRLPKLKGMYSAYKTLGAEDLYPLVNLGKSHESRIIPMLFEGDILFYLKDDIGPYCVNWTVKASEEQFYKKNPDEISVLQSPEEKERVAIRHAAEDLYYDDAGIPTHRITAKNFSINFNRNLKTAYSWSLRLNSKLKELVPITKLVIENTMGSGDTGVDFGLYICKRYKVTTYEWRIILYSLIWLRKININLEKPFFIDQPLTSHKKDNAEPWLVLLKRSQS
jgi:hypothetical protein